MPYHLTVSDRFMAHSAHWELTWPHMGSPVYWAKHRAKNRAFARRARRNKKCCRCLPCGGPPSSSQPSTR